MPQTNYSNPTIPLISSPVNLDRHIQDIQVAFSENLTWLDKSFGRAWPAERNENGKSYKYPEVYLSNGEYYDVLRNDHLASMSFIQVQKQKGKTLDYMPLTSNIYVYIIEAIFWFNLNRVDSSKTYRFNEELKTDVLNVITNKLPLLKVLNVYEAASDVYSGYDISHLDWQTFKHPYGGFKIELDLTFIEDCP